MHLPEMHACFRIIFAFLLGLVWTMPLAAGDIEAGRQIYAQCQVCHSLRRNRIGPRHCGLIGRKAGSVRGYDYSSAMRESGLVWNRETLDAFLTSPFATVPGNVMGYGGVRDDRKRADLIAFLLYANQSEHCDNAGN